MKINPVPVAHKPTDEDRALDRKFLAFNRKQPCAKCFKPPPSDPAHHRTAANSGVACKPLMSAIPLCRDCHRRQHQIGQYRFMPRVKWEQLVAHYVEKFKQEHGVDITV